jgi:hypothetical protein
MYVDEFTPVFINALRIIIGTLVCLITLAFFAKWYNQMKQEVEEERNQNKQNDIKLNRKND